MNRVTLPLAKMGARFNPSDVSCRSCISEPFDTLPLTVRGSAQLKGIDYKSPVASAQVKSAVLLAGLNASGQTRISEPHLSRNHSELLLPAFGAVLEADGLSVAVQGGQHLTAYDCQVPGDPSSAAFVLVAAAMIPGSEVTVTGMLLNPTRIGFIEVMRRMGADIAIEYSNIGTIGAERTGDVTVCYQPGLQATVVEASEIASLVDEVPILSLLATAAVGETVFEQVSELRVKESDRLAAIVNGLGALGLTASEQGDDLHVMGATGGGAVGQTGAATGPTATAGKSSGQLTLETHGDHRLAMTWAIAARAYGQSLEIANRDCVGVSYPGFFDDLERLSRDNGDGGRQPGSDSGDGSLCHLER
jgi:3-phosphoshikimate 1-carboxyvinyltransferase